MAYSKFKLIGTLKTIESVGEFSQITIDSQDSESIEFNNIKVPTITTGGEYFFYVEKEADVKIQEDSIKRNELLRDRGIKEIPKYIKLQWNPVGVSDNKRKPRVAVNDQKQRKLINVTLGVYAKFITDLNGLDVAFSSLANDNLFSNTLSTYVLGKHIQQIPYGLDVRLSISHLRKQTYLNLHNRALGKMIPNQAVLNRKTPDKQNIVLLGRSLKNMKFAKTEPEKFRSFSELNGLEYVGYIIEKERLDNSGFWVPIATFRIFGDKILFFKDVLVAYGVQYRYRIRSILRFTTKETEPIAPEGFTAINLNQIETDRIKADLANKSKMIESAITSMNQGLTYKSFDGNLTRRIPVGSNKTITAWSGFFSLDKVVDENNVRLNNLRLANNSAFEGALKDLFITDTASGENGGQPNIDPASNFMLSADNYGQKVYNSYYYSGEASGWSYVSIIDKEPPPYPQHLLITTNSTKRTVMLNWLPPISRQKDIKGYRVYFRSFFGDTWKILAELKKEDNIFIHKGLETGKKYIYAVTCVDMHGLESFLSTQVQAMLNPNYELEKKEKGLIWVSGPGAKLRETNSIYKTFVDTVDAVIVKRGINVSPKIDFSGKSREVMIRVTSLDTHEEREFYITIKNKLKSRPRPLALGNNGEKSYLYPNKSGVARDYTPPSTNSEGRIVTEEGGVSNIVSKDELETFMVDQLQNNNLASDAVGKFETTTETSINSSEVMSLQQVLATRQQYDEEFAGLTQEELSVLSNTGEALETPITTPEAINTQQASAPSAPTPIMPQQYVDPASKKG